MSGDELCIRFRIRKQENGTLVQLLYLRFIIGKETEENYIRIDEEKEDDEGFFVKFLERTKEY